MYRLIFAIAVIFVTMAPRHALSQGPSVLVLRHATVVDVIGDRLLQGQTVIVQGDKITAVLADADARLPAGARIIDCEGRFLIPGLWDMHTHVPELYLPDDPLRSERLGFDYSSALLLGNGVTGARVAAGNLRRLTAYRDEVRRGEKIGPRLLLTGQKLGEQPAVAGAPFPINSEQNARITVRLLKRDGADFVKVSSALPAQFWRAVADEAHKQNLPVVGHLPTTVSLRDASDLGMASIEHLFNLPRETSKDDELPENAKLTTVMSRKTGKVLTWLRIVDEPPQQIDLAIATHDTLKSKAKFGHLKERGTFVTPTLVLQTAMFREQDRMAAFDRRRYLTKGSDSIRYVDVRGVTPRMYSARLLSFHLSLVNELHQAGVSLLAGSDAPALSVHGFALHDELQLMVRAGLRPVDALRAATSNVGRFLRADSIGVIRSGAVADMVLLDEDPLRDISATRRIYAVVGAGRYFPRRALDRMLDSAAAIASRVPRDGRKAENIADPTPQ